MHEGEGTDATTRPPATHPLRRCAEAAAFVGVWIAVGYIFGLGDSTAGMNIYLLLTIPFVAAFQLVIRRQPLQHLWVREGPALTRRTISITAALLLAIFPVYSIVYLIDHSGGTANILYCLASLIGAVGGGYALKHFGRLQLRSLLLCLATAGVIGVLLFTKSATATGKHPLASVWSDHDVSVFFESLLTYLPALYVMEEVAFRGLLDSHVYHPGERHGILTAIFVSMLWGWWHLPITPGIPVIEAVFALLALQVPVGVFLSIFWRRSGNLAVPGTTHALIDSWRNALGSIP
jgi:membrane protease YdiL (CAAX protease family)